MYSNKLTGILVADGERRNGRTGRSARWLRQALSIAITLTDGGSKRATGQASVRCPTAANVATSSTAWRRALDYGLVHGQNCWNNHLHSLVFLQSTWKLKPGS